VLQGPFVADATTDDAVAVFEAGPEAGFGIAVDAGSDLTGDGMPDVLIGSEVHRDQPGAAYVFAGPFTGTSTPAAATASLVGGDSDGRAGFAVSMVGDATGDGIPDALVSSPYSDATGKYHGEVGLMPGPLSGTYSLEDDVVLRVHGHYGESYWGIFGLAGYDLGGQGDVDGDGVNDLLIGSMTVTGDELYSGEAYVFLGGSSSGDVSVSDADLLLQSEERDYIGSSVTFLGDVDGDGHGDLAVGSGDEYYGNGAGAWVFLGGTTGSRSAASAYCSLELESGYPEFMVVVGRVGDIDGDGLADVGVGVDGRAYGGDPEADGRAYLVSGLSTGAHSLADASEILDGRTHEGRFGRSLLALQDGDGDGQEEVLIGAEGEAFLSWSATR